MSMKDDLIAAGWTPPASTFTKPSLMQDIGEALEMASEISAEVYGYKVTDTGIIAEEYGNEGEVIATYKVEITVHSTKENNA